MKRQEIKYVRSTDDTTQTLTILVGETFEDTIVTEKLSVDETTGEKFTHFILESQSTEDQVTRSLEDLMEQVEDDKLLDELVIGSNPEDDALELELIND